MYYCFHSFAVPASISVFVCVASVVVSAGMVVVVAGVILVSCVVMVSLLEVPAPVPSFSMTVSFFCFFGFTVFPKGLCLVLLSFPSFSLP